MLPSRTGIIKQTIIPVEVTVIFIFSILFYYPWTRRIFHLVIATNPQFMIILLGIMCIGDALICFVEHIIDTGRIITTCLKVRRSCRITKTETTVIADIGLAYLSILGCNQNNSISSTGTIYSSSRSILQNTDGFYVIGIHLIYISLDSINNSQRCCIRTDRIDATDIEIPPLSGASRTKVYVHIRYGTLQKL